MSRLYQCLFVASLLALCWYGMQAVHEMGHIAAALLTGGTVTNVVLHPLSISRTDVAPNPAPAIVVWSGPLCGAVIPLLLSFLVQRPLLWRNIARLFAGFCLIANGAYVAVGSFDQVGDCREMFRTGTPQWVMVVVGATAVIAGLVTWHRLGSPREFIAHPERVSAVMAMIMLSVLVAVVTLEFLLSPR